MPIQQLICNNSLRSGAMATRGAAEERVAALEAELAATKAGLAETQAKKEKVAGDLAACQERAEKLAKEKASTQNKNMSKLRWQLKKAQAKLEELDAE